MALGSILVLPTSTVSETTLDSVPTNMQQSFRPTTIPTSTRTSGSASSSSVVRTTLYVVGTATVAVAVIAVVVVVVSVVAFQRKRKGGSMQLGMVTTAVR